MFLSGWLALINFPGLVRCTKPHHSTQHHHHSSTTASTSLHLPHTSTIVPSHLSAAQPPPSLVEFHVAYNTCI